MDERMTYRWYGWLSLIFAMTTGVALCTDAAIPAALAALGATLSLRAALAGALREGWRRGRTMLREAHDQIHRTWEDS